MMFRPLPKSGNRDEPSRLDVLDDLVPDLDLLVLALVRQVNETRSVSPMPRASSFSNARRDLMMPSGGMPASVTPRWSGTSGRTSANRGVRRHDLLGDRNP